MHRFGCLKMIFKTIQITLMAYIDQNHKLMVQKAFSEVRKACLPYVVEASFLLVKAHVVHEPCKQPLLAAIKSMLFLQHFEKASPFIRNIRSS